MRQYVQKYGFIDYGSNKVNPRQHKEITMLETMRLTVSTITGKQDSYDFLQDTRQLLSKESPLVILYGTGYGLTDEVHDAADCAITPVWG